MQRSVVLNIVGLTGRHIGENTPNIAAYMAAKSEIVIKEAAILFESRSHVGLDKVICVSADETTRVKRVQQRDNTTVDQIKSRISKQMHQDEKEELSDFVIVNDGKQLILPQVLEILSQIN